MAPVILRFVVNFSSQDTNYPVENILRTGEHKKWLCAKGTKTGTLEASFQLEKECIISAVHVGNHGSSFIELSVGRSDWPQDKDYVTLMPTSSLIPPKDAKIWERVETVKMYKKENFVSGASDQMWDRLKVRCSQPWRKDKQFGLTFLRVHSMDDVTNTSASNDSESLEIGSERLKQRYMEITGATREDIVSNPRTPLREELCSRSERIFKATLTPQNSKSGGETPGSDQKPSSNFYAELESFLRDLDVNQIMDDDLQVSDLRQKIERILCRPLTKAEKKIFRQRVPEYIQEFLDRSERKAKRRKAAAKLEYTMSTPLPEMKSPQSRTPKQKSPGLLDYESVFDDVTELPDMLSSPELATKSPAPHARRRSSPSPKNSSETKNMKTPKRPRSFIDLDGEARPKFSTGRSFLKKEQPKPSTSSHDNQDYYQRQVPQKKPKTDDSSSGGFFASDEILNRLGQSRSPIVLDSPTTPARRGNGGPPRGIKRERAGVHHLPPVICLGATAASPGASRRVVPPIQGRRIKHATIPKSIADVHPDIHLSCLPIAAQVPGRRIQSHSNSGNSGSGPRIQFHPNSVKNTVCPLCDVKFPSSMIEDHAAECDGLPDITTSRSDDVIVRSDVPSARRVSDVHDVKCPMCGLSFSGSEIEAHADRCADNGVLATEYHGARTTVCKYRSGSDDRLVEVESDQSRYRPVSHIFRSVFLPQGYPDSVSKDYFNYQLWDTVQAFASGITGTLAAQAVFKGYGVGNESATVAGATVTWLLKDGTGMLGRILFAWYQGAGLDCDAKRWRLFADILNDTAICVKILAPLFNHFTLLICFAGLCESIVGIAGSATRAALTQHQARRNNMADVSAKDGSQETMVNLAALVVGLTIIPVVTTNQVLVWLFFILFTCVHLYANYRAVKAVTMESMNQARLHILVQHYLKTDSILGVEYVNRQEPVVFATRWPLSIDLGTRLNDITTSHHELNQLKSLYEKSQYILNIHGRHISIALDRDSEPLDQLRACYHAEIMNYAFTNPDKFQPSSRGPLTADSPDFLRLTYSYCQRTFNTFLTDLEKQDWLLSPLLLGANEWRFSLSGPTGEGSPI